MFDLKSVTFKLSCRLHLRSQFLKQACEGTSQWLLVEESPVPAKTQLNGGVILIWVAGSNLSGTHYAIRQHTHHQKERTQGMARLRARHTRAGHRRNAPWCLPSWKAIATAQLSHPRGCHLWKQHAASRYCLSCAALLLLCPSLFFQQTSFINTNIISSHNARSDQHPYMILAASLATLLRRHLSEGPPGGSISTATHQ